MTESIVGTLEAFLSKMEDGSITRGELATMIALQERLIDLIERRGTACDLKLAAQGRRWLESLTAVLEQWPEAVSRR